MLPNKEDNYQNLININVKMPNKTIKYQNQINIKVNMPNKGTYFMSQMFKKYISCANKNRQRLHSQLKKP